jgi:hypothetical protein
MTGGLRSDQAMIALLKIVDGRNSPASIAMLAAIPRLVAGIWPPD